MSQSSYLKKILKRQMYFPFIPGAWLGTKGPSTPTNFSNVIEYPYFIIKGERMEQVVFKLEYF